MRRRRAPHLLHRRQQKRLDALKQRRRAAGEADEPGERLEEVVRVVRVGEARGDQREEIREAAQDLLGEREDLEVAESGIPDLLVEEEDDAQVAAQLVVVGLFERELHREAHVAQRGEERQEQIGRHGGTFLYLAGAPKPNGAGRRREGARGG